MSAFLKIETNYSDSDSDSSGVLTPRKTLLRIQTGLDLRSNTPSPPCIERRSPPRKIALKKSNSMPVFYSPKPNCVLKLIQTPQNLYKKNKNLKKEIENEIKETINELISTIEEKKLFYDMIHESSNYLNRIE